MPRAGANPHCIEAPRNNRVPIMRRWISMPIRVAVFLIGIAAYWMEISADWIIGARVKTEYLRTGICARCGKCCQCLALRMPGWISSRPRIVQFYISWHRLAMNFRPISIEDRHLLYGCGYYRDGRGCSIHPFRHRICRFFPRQRLYGHPTLDPECGYGFQKRIATPARGL